MALVVALGLHAVLVLGSRHASRGPEPHAQRPAELEIEVLAPPRDIAAASTVREQGEVPPARLANAAATLRATREAVERTPAIEGAPPLAPAAEVPPSTAPVASAPPAPIDLGLQGGVLRDALLGRRFDVPAPSKPSIGLLTEGLAQSDAAKGLSRSSAAVSAGYLAADRLAPPMGLALFEVRADATGAIVSVNLVSEGPDEAGWLQVAEAMRRELAKRKLRVPPGALGLLTRLRVERGQHAADPSAMNRLERGPAMGQGPLPPRQAADESTQSSLGRGLSPTLQVYSSEKKARATRVVIVSERVL